MDLYGTQLTTAELLARVGRMDQLASVTEVVDAAGPSRGARRVLVRSDQLCFDVHPDRGLDITRLAYRGTPLTWASAAGVTAPWLPVGAPADWLRTFSGGLVATCGLDTFGAPSEDDGESFPLHGRASTLQAEHVSCSAGWTGPDTDGPERDRPEDYELSVAGTLRQARTFGENLVLRRRIATRLGSAAVTIEDTVTNEGARPQPQMQLYHINLGWPLIDTSSVLHVPTSRVIPRDEQAARGAGFWNTFCAPDAGFAEQVFRHELAAPPGGAVEVRVTNPRLGLSLALEFDTGALPHLFQWRMLGSGTYVLGLEPANCPVIEGRAAARAAGVLPVLQPGQSRIYRLRFTVRPTATGTTTDVR